jgi:cellulose synthase/poly-beta-1,6-N-acetylglucosamine synthase-like glycosyltransferase
MSGARQTTVASIACGLACLIGVAMLIRLWNPVAFDPRLLVIVGLFGSLDLADVALRLYYRAAHLSPHGTRHTSPTSVPLDVGAFTPAQMRQHLKPYAIVVSVYNAEAELDDFIQSVRAYRDRLFVIDDASTDETFLQLRRAGIRCLRGAINRKKPGALRELVASLGPEITTIVVLDPDSRLLDSGTSDITDLERTVFEFQRSGFAAMCPCLTVRGEGFLGRFQQLEYWLSFTLGRYSLFDRCVTSGIALYRSDALTHVLRYSTSVYAEDLKSAFLLLAQNERIYYDGRLVVETAGKNTWPSWFSQRVGWHFGLLKVYAESWPGLLAWSRSRVFFLYHFVFYIGICGILLQPIRILAFCLVTASLIGGVDQILGLHLVPGGPLTDPSYFLVAYLQGTMQVTIALAATFERAKRPLLTRVLVVLPTYFFYSLAHAIPVTLGYLNWFTLRLFGRRVYRDHFDDDATLVAHMFGAKP